MILKSHILVVDDQEGIRKLLYEILSEQGYNVYLAANGIEAVKHNCLKKLSLAIIDLKMPGMDGLETIREIKKIAPGLPVILMTAYAESFDTTNSFEQKKLWSHVLIKPFDVSSLHRLLFNLLRYDKTNAVNII